MLELTAGGVVAVHDSSLGFRHGPKSILDDRTLVVVFVSSYPYTRQYDLDIVRELRRSVPQRDRPPELAHDVQVVLAGIGVARDEDDDEGAVVEDRLRPVPEPQRRVVHGHDTAGRQLEHLQCRLLGEAFSTGSGVAVSTGSGVAVSTGSGVAVSTSSCTRCRFWYRTS